MITISREKLVNELFGSGIVMLCPDEDGQVKVMTKKDLYKEVVDINTQYEGVQAFLLERQQELVARIAPLDANYDVNLHQQYEAVCRRLRTFNSLTED